jgi:hypothetical protein
MSPTILKNLAEFASARNICQITSALDLEFNRVVFVCPGGHALSLSRGTYRNHAKDPQLACALCTTKDTAQSKKIEGSFRLLCTKYVTEFTTFKALNDQFNKQRPLKTSPADLYAEWTVFAQLMAILGGGTGGGTGDDDGSSDELDTLKKRLFLSYRQGGDRFHVTTLRDFAAAIGYAAMVQRLNIGDTQPIIILF